MTPKGAVVASSPGRAAEKLPGPHPQGLARLLSRTGGGGRSRARSSPMFATRSKSDVGRSSSAATVVEGEPSSPKVTCIGQVRIKKKQAAGSKETKTVTSTPAPAPAPVRCQCLQRAFMCSLFTIRLKKKAMGGSSGGGARRKLWPSWRSNLRSGGGGGGGGGGGAYSKQRKAEADPDEKPPLEMVGGGRGSWFQEREEEAEPDEGEERTERSEEEEEEETRVFAPSATASATPPKNALLLMRCRSAPHNRASSLAMPRFSVSSLPEMMEEGNPEEGAAGDGDQRGVETEEDGKSRISSSRNEEEEEEEEEEMRCSSSRPLVLTRSKSEPASTAAKLVAPEAAAASRFWPSKDSDSRQRLLTPPVLLPR